MVGCDNWVRPTQNTLCEGSTDREKEGGKETGHMFSLIFLVDHLMLRMSVPDWRWQFHVFTARFAPFQLALLIELIQSPYWQIKVVGQSIRPPFKKIEDMTGLRKWSQNILDSPWWWESPSHITYPGPVPAVEHWTLVRPKSCVQLWQLSV